MCLLKLLTRKTDAQKILTFNFKNVGEVLVRKSSMKVMKATPLNSLGKNIQQKRREVGYLVEKDLIKVIGNPKMHIQFSKLRHALHGIEPMYRTLIRLLNEDYPSYEESADITHYIDQISLLVDVNYAEFVPSINAPNAKLIATNKLKQLYYQEKSVEKTVDGVLAVVLSEFYYDLKKQMRIFQFVPYIKASAGYYGSAIQFGQMLGMTKDRLKVATREYYRDVPLTKRLNYAFSGMINELIDAKILGNEGEYITGRKEIFDQLIEMRSSLPMHDEPVILG